MKMRSAVEALVADADLVRPTRSGRGPSKTVQFCSLAQPASTPVRDCAGDLVLARLDARHVDGDGATDADAELGGAARQMRGVGARDHRLGRDAAGVDAGAAEPTALDDRDLHAGAGEAAGDERPGLPGADDDGVVLRIDMTPQRQIS